MKTKIILLLIFVVILYSCADYENLFTPKPNVLEDVDLTEHREKSPLGTRLDSILTPSSIVPILSPIATIIITWFIYKINKSSNINERKMDFYNKACHDLWESRPRKIPVKLKDMEESMKVATFIERHRNLCISDGIWEDIMEGVHYIGSGSEFPFEDEYNQELREDVCDKSDEYIVAIYEILYEMQKQYEKKFYN